MRASGREESQTQPLVPWKKKHLATVSLENGSDGSCAVRGSMLRVLEISQFALIEQLRIEFGTGLNLLTGETGSGKSIIVDALGLLLGEKGYSEMVRSGFDRSTITGV